MTDLDYARFNPHVTFPMASEKTLVSYHFKTICVMTKQLLLYSADVVKLRLRNAYILVLNVSKGKLNKLSKLVLTMYVYGETRTTKLVKAQCHLKISCV